MESFGTLTYQCSFDILKFEKFPKTSVPLEPPKSLLEALTLLGSIFGPSVLEASMLRIVIHDTIKAIAKSFGIGLTSAEFKNGN